MGEINKDFKKTLLFVFHALIIGTLTAFAAEKPLADSYDNLDGNRNQQDAPTIEIHDTIVGPGELLLQVDALDFTGENGQVGAITLRIDIDTNLLTFEGITNTSIPGSWFANYNTQLNEITINYNAPLGTGYDIDGKLLDLKLYYWGGFTADLHFKDNCEVSDKNLQTIEGVVYEDGSIQQTEAFGVVRMDTVVTYENAEFEMPVIMGGDDFDSITSFYYWIEFDTAKLSYDGFIEKAITGIDVEDTANKLLISWSDTLNPVSLTMEDTVFLIEFTNNGDTISETAFLPGSLVENNKQIVSSDFVDGRVEIMYFLELEAGPSGAGTTSGEGYYLPEENVTVSAASEQGYYFENWSIGDSIISTDSVFVFAMTDYDVTLTANFEAFDYTLSLLIEPMNSGQVSGGGIYHVGDSATITATPNTGYEFLHWTSADTIVSEEPVYTFAMPASNVEMTAYFDTLTYTINAIPNNSDYGSVSGAGEYNHGDTVTLLATPFQGHRFVVWTESGLVVWEEEEYEFIATSDRDLIAHFQLVQDCPAPVALSVSDLGLYEATLHWVPSGAEEEWDVLWGPMGFDTVSQGELVSGLTENQYLLEDLEEGTNYDFYVSAVCSEEMQSAWAGPESFTTLYVGIEPESVLSNVIVYPNPFDEKICMRNKGEKEEKILVQIFDNTGGLILERQNHLSRSLCIETGKLRPGLYHLIVRMDDGILRERIICY
ncbi:MAG: hypothetical protein K9H15_10490 [Bacteroidales bacterium]|nr:hypothetical protein [Bacteroidales bacterium]